MRSELQGFALQDFIFLQLGKKSKKSTEKNDTYDRVFFMCKVFLNYNKSGN